MDKLKMHSVNGIQKNIEIIGKLFPDVITEVERDGEVKYAIDFDALRDNLSEEIVEGNKERYQFTWPDKKKAKLLANTPISATLRPVREESVNFDTTENLYIEGDNLDVLKLLQETYLGKVKMIYIDPPYNTGNDFVYNDYYTQRFNEYRLNSGQYDDEGYRLNRNVESNGRFHTAWLNMMYARLKLAKNLLSSDGAIFISIDDKENENLRKICDEILGEANFFCQIIVQSNKRGQTYKQISKTHEYLLIYVKSDNAIFNELEKTGDKDDLNLMDNLGRFNIRELRNRNPKFGKFNRPNLYYPIYVKATDSDKDDFYSVSLQKSQQYCVEVYPHNSSNEESCWRWGKKLFLDNVSSDTKNSNVIARKKMNGEFNIYEKYRKNTYKPKSIWDDTSMITEKGTEELNKLGLSRFFDFPKPVELIKKSILLGMNPDDLILDFFSGSATTAQAVMELNSQNNNNYKYIMVQLPESLNIESEISDNRFHTICDIGKERIRRAAKKIHEEYPNSKFDDGFRVLRLDSSNMKDSYLQSTRYISRYVCPCCR
jgi:adenine-specific DNA-methyltransferase